MTAKDSILKEDEILCRSGYIIYLCTEVSPRNVRVLLSNCSKSRVHLFGQNIKELDAEWTEYIAEIRRKPSHVIVPLIKKTAKLKSFY